MAGDEDDKRIWAFFVMQRLSMEASARAPWPMAQQGNILSKMAGLVAAIRDRRRFADVLYEYGRMLRDGLELGDVTRPPWDTR
jgi:hypothetical protein